uniref:phenylalanine--tRNA ligase subunit beta-related protein n=1 Tax=Salmonella enterica TaxID=28901 RepID=UPI001590EAB6
YIFIFGNTAEEVEALRRQGYKSLAISLILQDTNRTLEEEEIAATVAKCVEALKERFQASLRD